MAIFCKLINHFYDTYYDIFYSGSYIPKRSFIMPPNSKIHLAHPTHIAIIKSVVSHINCKEFYPSAILDVGCGYGRVLNYFSRHFNCPVDGVELIEALVEQSKFYNKNRANVVYGGDATEILTPMRLCE